MKDFILTLIYAKRVWYRNIKVFTKIYKAGLVLNFVDPMMFLLFFGLGLGKYIQDIDGMSYLKFIAPGIMIYSGMMAAIFECTYGTYTRMVFQKTFDAILATPITKSGVILGEIFYGATKSLVFSSIILIVLFVTGIIKSPFALAILPFIFIAGIFMGSISLWATAIVPGVESYNYFFTLIFNPMMFLSGIYFPLSGLMLKIAYVSPFFHVTMISQSLARGETNGLFIHIALLCVISLLSVFVAIKLMKKRLEK